MNLEYAEKIELLMKQWEEMRIEKETEIKRLTIQIEEMRTTYELRINELELTLQKYQQMTIKLEATVLEKDTRLGQKEDVEEQLGTW